MYLSKLPNELVVIAKCIRPKPFIQILIACSRRVGKQGPAISEIGIKEVAADAALERWRKFTFQTL